MYFHSSEQAVVLTSHPQFNTSTMNREWNQTAFHSLYILIMFQIESKQCGYYVWSDYK